MKVIKSIGSMKKLSDGFKKAGASIGFVPTMGYLHEGHLSLVKEAKKQNDIVVVSVFVNPTQFTPKDDLKKYPRDLKRDLKMLAKHKVDVVFHPSANEIYPEGYSAYVEVKGLSDMLCGASRPGHFRGVTTIVAKLFNIVKPDAAYFGEKDFQQQVIIRKMVKDLDMDVKIVSMPTIRENDGLAMSSRNSYLSREERKDALVINRALRLAEMLVNKGVKSASRIKSAMSKLMKTAKSLRIDYISICDPTTLEEKKHINGKTLIAAAAYVGKARLIDNILIT
ncbi:MAG: pantoate--beta-alanine ligase [bacterium]